MSEKHKQILLAGNAAISAGNNEGFLEYCTEDTEWNFIGEQLLKGKEAVRQWMEKTYLEPPQVTVENLLAEGDFLIAQGEVTMKDESGKAITYAYCDVWKFRDDRLAALKAYVIGPKDLD
jgi:ketosteroid isomerase-like protein